MIKEKFWELFSELCVVLLVCCPVPGGSSSHQLPFDQLKCWNYEMWRFVSATELALK
jgi:hypothetical protein